MGVVKVAPFGTRPMAIVDGTAGRPAAANLPTAPMGTGLALLIVGAMMAAAAFIFRRRRIWPTFFRVVANPWPPPGYLLIRTLP